MCVIIIKKNKNQNPPIEVLRTASVINPHGLSVTYLDTGMIVRTKSNDHKLLRELANTERKYIAHFRYATRGNKSDTHPFPIGDTDCWLFQNGTVESMGSPRKTDTEEMADILSLLPKNRWRSLLEMSDSRWVTFDQQNFNFDIYNKPFWYKQEGVMYSKANVLNTNLVAVYGTLKRGKGNYYRLLHNDEEAQFLSKGQTTHRYPMVVDGIPYLYKEKGKGHYIDVELFRVSNNKLAELDELEGHPEWYKRHLDWVKTPSGSRKAWVYFMQGLPSSNIFHHTYE
jgi:gamma-glutamylaminecyclotransferase